MAGRFKYGERYRYPHMKREEIEVWERFMKANPGMFETVDYDFRVGTGSTIPLGTPENYKRMITMLSQKRIDVLGWVGDSPEIIEVKKRVGLSALGQVLGYKILFMKEFTHFKEPELMVVCEMISEDDHEILRANKIRIYIV